MHLINTDQVPRIGILRTFRHSRLGSVLLMLVVAGATLWWTSAVSLSEGAQWYHWFPVVLGLTMVIVIAGLLRKSFHSSNWLMKIDPDGVYIKFRSYLNSHYREDSPIVVCVPFSEIASVGAYRRTISLPSTSGGITAVWLSCLEIELSHDRTSTLARALAAERALRPAGNRAAKYHDYALRLADPRRLRLRWNASPGLKPTVRAISGFAPVHEPRVDPPVVWQNATPEVREAVIIELAEFGDKIAAQKLAAAHYALDTAESVRLIEQLMGNPPP